MWYDDGMAGSARLRSSDGGAATATVTAGGESRKHDDDDDGASSDSTVLALAAGAFAPGARENRQHAIEAGVAAGTAGSRGGGVARGKRVP